MSIVWAMKPPRAQVKDGGGGGGVDCGGGAVVRGQWQ